MNPRQQAALLMIVAAGMTSCSSTQVSGRDPGNPKLTRYETADPIADCRAAIRRSDFRFLAIAGMALDFPGIPDFKRKYWHRYSYRVIEGTSEFVSGPEDMRLQGVAAKYAARYNRFLLHYLSLHHE